MLVSVTLTIDVDVDTWCEVYGTDRSEVRRNVKGYAQNQILQSAASDEGAIKEVLAR